MENTRYLKDRKKKNRIWIGAVLALLLTAAAAGGFFYEKERSREENPNSEEAVVPEENQRWLLLQIDTIEGNEIQAVEIEEAETEEKTYQIPVGTDVVTRLGSVTTFSRLAAGDVIRCLMEQTEEEEVILKIWIEEQQMAYE